MYPRKRYDSPIIFFICLITLALDSPFIFIGFISWMNLLPVHDFMFHRPSISSSFLSSNSCSMKFSWTAGDATTVIRFVMPSW